MVTAHIKHGRERRGAPPVIRVEREPCGDARELPRSPTKPQVEPGLTRELVRDLLPNRVEDFVDRRRQVRSAIDRVLEC